MLKEALPTGGAERQLALIVKHLPPWWERRVWTMGGGPFADELAADGFRVDVAPRAARFDVRPTLPLWRVLFEWRPDVVHSWDWMSTLAALPLCRLLGIPLVDATIRNGTVRPRGSVQRKLSQAVSTRVVANSRAGLQAWGIGPRRGRVVYNAFDPARLDAAGLPPGEPADLPAGEPAGEPPGEPVAVGPRCVVMTGRMVADKDFSVLIAAARRLDRERPGEWCFLLLGDGPEKPRLAAEAGELCPRGVVRFVDPGLEVLPLVREAHIGVLMANEARNREGCSNAIMEYMSCALPVVCSAGGGNPELVLDGETGYVVQPGDAAALADALAVLADRPELARRMGDAGRRRILEEFSIARLVSSIERVYWEALS
jgi:glycosyltransferase involved in cell wall biosynthesis